MLEKVINDAGGGIPLPATPEQAFLRTRLQFKATGQSSGTALAAASSGKDSNWEGKFEKFSKDYEKLKAAGGCGGGGKSSLKCHYCAKEGHKWADYRKRKKDDKEKKDG